MINTKMFIVSIHLSRPILSYPSTPEKNSSCSSNEKTPEEHNASYFSEEKPPLPRLLTPRCCFGTIVFNDTIFVIGKFRNRQKFSEFSIFLSGGYNRSDCLDSIEQYNLKENQWNGFQYSLTSRRGRVSATIFNDQIYVCGGSDGQKELDLAERLDLKSMKKWTTIKELTEPVAHSGKIEH